MLRKEKKVPKSKSSQKGYPDVDIDLAVSYLVYAPREGHAPPARP